MPGTDPPAPGVAGAAAAPAAPGRLLGGRYRLAARLARGGMAEVWEATDEVLARPVAVKVLLAHLADDADVVGRFRREAVAAARLNHPGIVAIFDTLSEDEPRVEAIVMELVRGRTLHDVLTGEAPLAPARAVALGVAVAAALAHAHRQGVVHRDVKPANVLLAHDGRVLVTDFGIAKAVRDRGADATVTGQILGTPRYLAPEQVEGGPVDARTDVYALGAVLYELVCGRPAFEGDTDVALAAARLTRTPLRPRQVRAGVPRDLEAVLLRALARRPDDRQPDCEALRAELLGLDAARGGLPALTGQGGDPVAPPPDASEAPTRAGTEPGWALADPQPGTGTNAKTVGGPPGAGTDTRAPDDTPPAGLPHFARTERRWLVPAAVIALAGAALGVAGLLLGTTEVGQGLFRRTRDAVDRAVGAAPAAVEVAGVASFDPPPGDGREHDDLLPHLVDGDAATGWTTERYDSPAFGNLKDGVGVVFHLDAPQDLRQLTVDASHEGWSAEVRVADGPAPGLAGWGAPVATGDDLGTTATFDLADARGGAVLLWITGLGGGPGPVRLELTEVSLRG